MNKNEFQFLAAIKNHQLIKIKKIDFTVSHKKNEIFCIINKNLTSLNTLWIMAPCSSQALVNSRFALMTWASASLIGLVHALTLLVRTCVSWRLFEATSAKEEQLWPLWLTSMHSHKPYDHNPRRISGIAVYVLDRKRSQATTPGRQLCDHNLLCCECESRLQDYTCPLGSLSRKRWQDVHHYKLRKCISVHLLRNGVWHLY